MDADNLGIPVVQLKALYKISVKPNIGLGELAENLKLTSSTVSGVIDRLVKNGYVERYNPTHDRRTITLQMTNLGESKLAQFTESQSELHLVQRLNKINEFPKEDIEQLLRIHKQIINVLSR